MLSKLLFWKYRKVTQYESCSPLSVGNFRFFPIRTIEGFLIERRNKPLPYVKVAFEHTRHTEEELTWLASKSANDYLLLISKKEDNVYVE